MLKERTTPSQYLFNGGYASFSNDALSGWHYYIQDYMGNNRMVVNRNGSTEQITHYYPYGGMIGGISTNETLQAYKFEGKELDRTFGLDNYDVHARNYFAMLPMWDRVDPMAEKNNNVTPYSYCNGNPVNLIDFNGCDTLNISYINNKWCFDSPIIAKGNDVFNVTIDGKTTAYTFSEGVYGDRVDALNLELNKDYTLGIYHISGVSLIGTGYYVTPGGAPSTKDKSGARIPEGTYPIVEGKGYNWKKAGVGGSVEERGIRFHYEVSKNHNPRYSTSGCFVLSYDYTPQKNGSVKYDRNESIYASRNFDILVGGSYTYINKNNEREATKFLNPITAKLVLKSRRQ